MGNDNTSQLEDRCVRKQVRRGFRKAVAGIRKKLSAAGDTKTIDDVLGSGYLGESLGHVNDGRDAFTGDARQLVALVMIMFVGAAIIQYVALTATLRASQSFLLSLSSLLLASFTPWVIDAVGRKAAASYEYYVAASIHAYVVHEAAGCGNSHAWFAHAKRCIDSATLKNYNALSCPRGSVSQEWVRVAICRWEDSTSRGDGRNLLQAFYNLVFTAYCAAAISCFVGAMLLLARHDGDLRRWLSGDIVPVSSGSHRAWVFLGAGLYSFGLWVAWGLCRHFRNSNGNAGRFTWSDERYKEETTKIVQGMRQLNTAQWNALASKYQDQPGVLLEIVESLRLRKKGIDDFLSVERRLQASHPTLVIGWKAIVSYLDVLDNCSPHDESPKSA